MPRHNPEATEALAKAIALGDIENVTKAIADGADVNAKIKHKLVPYIHFAVATGNAAIVHALLEAGADANSQDLSPGSKHTTPILIAAYSTRPAMPAIIADLAAHRARLDDISAQAKLTPLTIAIEAKNYPTAEALLVAGANPDATCNGTSPLDLAINKEDLTAIELLKRYGANFKNATIAVMSFSVIKGTFNTALCNKLLELGADIHATQEERNALHLAVVVGNIEAIRFFCTHGIDPNKFSKIDLSYLTLALFTGRMDIYKLLLSLGADPDATDAKGQSIMHATVATGIANNIQFLLENGARMDIADSDGHTPLHLLMLYIGKLAKVRDKLAATGPLPDHPVAAFIKNMLSMDYIGAISLTLQAHAPVNARNKEGLTPLDLGFRNLPKEINSTVIESLFLLAKNGGLLSHSTLELMKTNRNRYPSELLAIAAILTYPNAEHPYVLAARSGDLALLQSQTSPIAPEIINEALMNAIVMGNIEICVHLLNNGAQPLHQGPDGNYALHLASQTHRVDIATLLINHGGYITGETGGSNVYREPPLQWFNTTEKKLLRTAAQAYKAAHPAAVEEVVKKPAPAAVIVEVSLPIVKTIDPMQLKYEQLLQAVHGYLEDAEKSHQADAECDLADWLKLANKALAQARKIDADERKLAPLAARISTYEKKLSVIEKSHTEPVRTPEASTEKREPLPKIRPQRAEPAAAAVRTSKEARVAMVIAASTAAASASNTCTASVRPVIDSKHSANFKELFLRLDSLCEAYRKLNKEDGEKPEAPHLLSAMQYNLIRLFELARQAGAKAAGRIRAQLRHHYFNVSPKELLALTTICLSQNPDAVEFASISTQVMATDYYRGKVNIGTDFVDVRSVEEHVVTFRAAISLLEDLYQKTFKYYESEGTRAVASYFDYAPHSADAARMHIMVLGQILRGPHKKVLNDLLLSALDTGEAKLFRGLIGTLRNIGGHEVDTVADEGFIVEVISSFNIANIIRTAHKLHEAINLGKAKSVTAVSSAADASIMSGAGWKPGKDVALGSHM